LSRRAAFVRGQAQVRFRKAVAKVAVCKPVAIFQEIFDLL
jgi:hypothetical protein